MSAAFLHAFAMSRISPCGSLRCPDRGISSGLRLIANRNKKKIQTRLPLGDLGQQRLHDDAISSRPGRRSIA
jgi:hypothetical protein